jgi:hypothetical protein
MRKSNVVAFVLSSVAVGLVVACGSSPKPDTNTATTPSATPTTTATSTPDMAGDASTGGATSTTGDAGGGGTAAAPTKEQQCETLQSDAQAEMDAERIKVDKTCKKDADCMPIKGRACQFICTNGSIPKSEQAEWDREMKAVNDGPCKKWNELGCKKADAKPPTCSDDKKKPACDKGHCILK